MPRRAPAVRRYSTRPQVKGDFELELAFCEVAPLSEEELLKEEEAGDAASGRRGAIPRRASRGRPTALLQVVDGKPPGGPLTGLGTTRAPPELSPKDVGFMPFKSPIEAGQAAMRAPSKRERSNGTVG